MKKGLFATTALVAASAAALTVASPVMAQDDDTSTLQLGVGGYYNVWFTGTTQDEYGVTAAGNPVPNTSVNDFDTFDVRQEGEIQFTGSATLDNGIEAGFDVQLEAETTGDQIDEHYVYVESSFGRVQVGAENGAANLMHYAAPSVGILVNSPTFAFYQSETGLTTTTNPAGPNNTVTNAPATPNAIGGIPTPAGTTSVSVLAPTANYVNASSDANKLTYFTPRIAGFQLGASYTPDVAATGGNSNAGGLSQDDTNSGAGYEIGANYVNSFNGFDVALSAGYGYVEEDLTIQTTRFLSNAGPGGNGPGAEDQTQYSVGLNVGYAGFTVGTSYGETRDAGFVSDHDQWLWDVGASYATGPWTVGLSYAMSETEIPGEVVNLANNAGGNRGGTNERDLVNAGVEYALGGGVTTKAVLGWVNEENGWTQNDSDGFYGGIGMGLSF
jgi:hypothetical protein